MRSLNPLNPDEQPALLMENELLRYEIAYLRSRVAEAESRATRAAATSAKKGKAPADAELHADAHRELVRLLRRLDGSSLGPVLRRRGSFRDLVTRFVPRDPA